MRYCKTGISIKRRREPCFNTFRDWSADNGFKRHYFYNCRLKLSISVSVFLKSLFLNPAQFICGGDFFTKKGSTSKLEVEPFFAFLVLSD
ncbi:hypothetical protein COV49_03985 [Candidatus Falkowbacteria bacterium CG11_big_fil_rev_8_21_14_0_20_39_10]|uniref:Uncharacterized protein n=1 Tax=Candidatus Falkowbacteria bacterium CG11_big_fil_rev_8_21_14_0_20_39_10 TaxID=1974570 RepID=A0A2M6K8F6_9BACT|nr:MAG: hypothetical protein COV49_03985 [Candidatus Falkowbacteria bacterium CG11_big_fil_rev_8_21_14_0_20_39_10]